MYAQVRRVTGSLARQLRDLRTMGIISYSVFKYAMKSTSNAKKIVKNNEVALSQYKAKYKAKKGQYQSLKQKVNEIAKSLENERAVHVHRMRNTDKRLASVNAMALNNFTLFSTSVLETPCANLRYFDPGTNALVTADAASGTYAREIQVDKLYAKVIARNNYQVPCRYTAYVCVPKNDTSIAPTTFFTAGLADQGNPTNTSPLVHFTDSRIMMENWKIAKSESKVLNPGEECVIVWSVDKPFEYDFSNVDSHNLTYQRKYGAATLITRVEGVLGHDTVADEQGFLEAGVDLEVHRKIQYSYDAGKNLYDISISDTVDTFTNGGVCSMQPVADNQGYSVA